MNLRKLKCGKGKSRKAISEVMGAVLLLGITIAVGFMVWNWTRGEAITNENNLGKTVTENFVIANVNYSSINQNEFTITIYNAGLNTVSINAILVSNSTWTFANSTLSVQIASGALVSTTLISTAPFSSSRLYTFKAISGQGTVATYVEEG